jgi:2-dehydro-3-deoxygluconokinase
MTDRFDVIALGETMLSLIAENGALDTATRFLVTHGGAESNACAALARGGLRVAWVSRLGTDVAGRRIRSALTDAGVHLSWVTDDPDRPTGVMLRDALGALQYLRAGSAASALGPSDLDGVPVEHARAVLVTGITAMIGPDPRDAAIALLERANGLRIVDPNLRPGLWGSDRARELVLPLIERCDILIGSQDELRLFAEGSGSSLATACAALGPPEVVVTRGAAGASALAPDGGWYEHPAEPAIERDPVGAGDAFTAAYLAARLDGADVPSALKAGAVAGAQTASRVGDTAIRR